MFDRNVYRRFLVEFLSKAIVFDFDGTYIIW